ncbi:hypothetical protein [Prescottella agglutinans]|uniref:Uncharacterized protein n=1 Tax=Prescottella agglutinans TaxID=1644129 RepID=A0ABT6MLQ1_9NOCA|nr:hypothetical protein [Prescottella agglutinans]MDH6284909.1 hypothetical protein [Prescottella agglutinans]
MVSLASAVMVMSSPAARVFVELFLWAVWAGIAYLFVAIGTKLSPGMATSGIALVAGLNSVANAVSELIGLSMVNTTNQLLGGTDINVPGEGMFVALSDGGGFRGVGLLLRGEDVRGSRLIDSAPAPTPTPIDPCVGQAEP